MKKRVVSLLLCLIMALSLIPTVAFAAEASSQDDGISLTSIRPDDQRYYTYEFYNGSSSTPISTQIVKEGDTLYQPATPTTEEGKVFIGWYDENGDPFTGFGTVGTIAKNDTIKLYAKIEDGYYVFFMDNKGTVIDTKTGKTGAEIKFDDVSFPVEADQAITGWYTDKDCTESAGTSVTIGAKNIYLYAKVENGHWITFDSVGGSYVEPKFFKTGANTEEPNDPAKPGYAFAGWYNGDTEYTFGSALTESITLKAKWTAKDGVPYTVIHWQENANDDGYSFAESEQLTGTPGQLTEDAVDKSYEGFTLNQDKTDEQKTIAGNGSTIVNVYYKRNVYKVIFATNSDNGPDPLCGKEEHEHTYTERKGNWWNGYKYKGGCYPQDTFSNSRICGKDEHTHTHGGWFQDSCYGTIYKELTIEAKYGAYIGNKWPTKDGSNTWALERNGNTYQVNIDTMPLGGATFYGPKTGQGSETAYYYVEVLPGETGTVGPNKEYKEHHRDTSPGTGYTVTQNDKYKIKGFTYKSGTDNGRPYNNAKFYYTRNSYKIVFMNNGQEKTVLRKYEQSIANDSYTPTAPAGKEGYTFVGWYDNDLCEGEKYVFAGKTMPDQNITLYAKWEEPVHTVTVYDIDRTKVLKTFENVSHGSTIDVKKMPANYTLPKGYKFLGWVLLEDGTPFNFNTEITRNYNLYAKIGSMATYTVTYKANNGSDDTVVDPLKYAMGAYASVKANSFNAPSGQVFLGWSTTASGSVAYYANSQLKIEKQNVILYAIWGDKDSTVTLTYNANYGEKPATNTIYSIKNNAKVTLKQFTELFPARDGYRFTEWNTQADGKGDSFDANERVRVDKVDPPNVLYAQWKRQTGTLIINKVVEGVTLDEDKTFQFQLYTKGTDEYVPYGRPIAVTIEAGGTSGSTTVSVPTDMYFVQEIATSAAIDNYSVTTAYERNGGSIPVLDDVVIDGTAAVVTESGNTTVKVTNTYEAQTADLTIVKKLNTALPQNMTFTFNVKEGTSATTTAEITIKAGDLEGSTTVKDLKIGTRYTVQEDTTSAQVIGYTLTAPGAQKVTINATGAQVEFVNYYAKDTTSVTVTKMWDYKGVVDEKDRPTEITVQLLANGTEIKTATLYTTNEWTHTWDKLPTYDENGAIEYTVVEKDVPAGFTDTVIKDATADHPTFIITNAANVVEVPEIVPASLTVIKKDADNGALLKGAKFTLIPEGGKATDAAFAETDENGKAVFTDLAKGTYTLKEITAPAGYQATDKTWTITVSDDAKTAAYKLVAGKFVKTITCKVDDVENVVSNGTITITNAKNTGTLTISKMLKGDLVATDFEDGFAFDIKDASGKVVATVDEVFPGMAQPATVTLVPGTYTIVEKSADKDGYDLTTEYDKETFTVEAGKNVIVTVTNTYTKKVTPPPAEYTLSVDIQKNIELKRSSSRKPGKASFTFEAYLVDEKGNETILDTVTIDTKGTKSADGTLTFTLTEDDLSVTGHGTVYVREVKGSTRGWTYDDTVYALGVELTTDGKLNIISVDTKRIDKPATLEFTNVYYKRSTTTGGGDKPIQSVKTGDMGIAMYAMTSLLSLGGAALVIKKRKEEK